MGDLRYFLCPENLLSPEEIPEGWGLLFCVPVKTPNPKGFPFRIRLIQEPTPQNMDKVRAAEAPFLKSVIRRLDISGALEPALEIYSLTSKADRLRGQVETLTKYASRLYRFCTHKQGMARLLEKKIFQKVKTMDDF